MKRRPPDIEGENGPGRREKKPQTVFLVICPRVAVFLLTAWIFVFGLGAPSVLSAEPSLHYWIKARVDVPKKELTATEVVTYTNTSTRDIGEMVFHIYPNRRYSPSEISFMYRYGGYFKVNPFPGGFQETPMHLGGIKARDRDLSYQITGKDQTILKVALKDPLKPGDSIELAIDFSFILPHTYGRLGWQDHIIKLSHWYPILAVNGKDGWNENPFYPFHRPFFSDAANYDVELTVPANQVVIHSGVQDGVKEAGKGEKTLILKTYAPVREFAVAMSPHYKEVSETIDGIKLRSFYLFGDEEAGKRALESARDVMRFYTQRFGNYLCSEFSIAPVHLGYGGEQHSNVIFIDTRVYKLPRLLARYFDFIIAHETGHQWFYNQLGVNEYTQMWLEEGANSYFIERYIDAKYGINADVLNFPPWLADYKGALPSLTFPRTRDFRYKMIVRSGYDNPVLSPLSSFREPASIFSLAYGKGARIFAMLRETIGDEVFNRVFKRLFADYQYKNMDISDFVRVCEEESGKKLEWFFDQWLKTAHYLDYGIADVQGRKVLLKNNGGIMMPVDVKIDFSDGQSEVVSWAGDQKADFLDLGAGARITKVAIDPEGKLLDIDRTDNFWPRKLNVKPVPLYFGLYDVPLFMPEDSYNVVVGPEAANGGLGIKASVQKPYEQILYGGTDYEFGESLQHSRVGYQLKNIFRTQTAAGIELSNTADYDDGVDDFASGKVYLRRELWPAAYSMTEINDHMTFYLIRNQRLGDRPEFLDAREDDSHFDYSRRKEAIVGTVLHLDRSGPSPDPRQGMKFDWQLESAGHFWGATQYFYRSAWDARFYIPVLGKTILAARAKYGWGYPNDKDLYQLGGMNDLRGFGRKDVRGANMLLGSLEYRFPIVERIDLFALDNIVGVESFGGVIFFDAGQGWFDEITDTRIKQDVGVGLRFMINFGSFLEKIVIRADAAKSLDDPGEDMHFWVGINHAF